MVAMKYSIRAFYMNITVRAGTFLFSSLPFQAFFIQLDLSIARIYQFLQLNQEAYPCLFT